MFVFSKSCNKSHNYGAAKKSQMIKSERYFFMSVKQLSALANFLYKCIYDPKGRFAPILL